MEFRILGPIEVHGRSGAVALGGAKPRTVLAMLLLHANEPVSAERLAIALWGDDAPQRAIRAVQVYVSRLRTAIGEADRLITTPAGYRLRVDPGELDAERFAHLVERGRGERALGRAEDAATTIREALAIWRGPALGDLAFDAFAQVEVARLEELRLSALEARIEADLDAGRHDTLIAELRQLVPANPSRERLAGQLMLALYRAGRQSDALDVYQDARRALVEIGVEPGPELRQLQAAILSQDAALDPQPRERELPAALATAGEPALAGRDAELARLRESWQRARAGAGEVVVLAGVPGSGRTRLAAELAGEAHREGATVLYRRGVADGERLRAELRASSKAVLLVVDDADDSGADEAVALALRLAASLDARAALAILVVDEAHAPDRGPAIRTIRLPAIDVDDVIAIAATYAPAQPHADIPGRRLLEASRGIPGRVHELAAQWARSEAARRVGVAAERAASGRAELRAMEEALTGDVIELHEASERASLPNGEPDAVVCPFKGLAAFHSADAGYFFGRERLVAELVARLVGAPLLGIVGPSGSGKSSVMRAGLLPALAAGVLPASEAWRQIVLRPGEHPLQELRDACAAVAGDERLVLAVDQFEELFTLCGDEAERAAFVGDLVGMARERRDRRIVVLAIRADQYGRCAAYAELARLLAPNHVLVRPMAAGELRMAIERPSRRAGLQIEEALTRALIEDVRDEPGALPLLSTALLELWQHREGRRLTHASYQLAGGVKGAVARLAEDAYSRLDPSQQEVGRSVLLRLAAIGEDGAVERRRAALDELKTDATATAPVVELLADARLLSVGSGSVEIAHEALLREWPRLRAWIDDNRAGLRIQRAITTAAQEWLRLDRDEGELYRGARLAEALEWRATRTPVLTALESEFLAASADLRTRERSARRRRIRGAFALMTAMIVAISVVAITAVRQRNTAKHERDAAASRSLADRATSLLDVDPGLSLGLALRAVRRSDTVQGRDAIRQATYVARGTGVWPANGKWARGAMPSRDGRRAVTFGDDGWIRTWDYAKPKPVAAFRAERGVILDAALSPDGLRVADASVTGLVTIRDLDGARPRVALKLDDNRFVTGLSYGPDGRRLAISASDGSVRVIDVDGNGRTVMLPGFPSFAQTTRFDAAGDAVVSGAYDGRVRIDALDGRPSIAFRQPDPVLGASFSPDGRHVATAGHNGLVRIWSARDGRRLASFRADRGSVSTVRFSPDGHRLVTAGEEGVVRLWTLSGLKLGDLRGHRGSATSAAFVPGGEVVLSTGEDGTMRRWAPAASAMMRGAATEASFDASGRRVLSGGIDGLVRVWSPARDVTTVLRGQKQETVARFSPDGRSVVGASLDGSVRVWDLRTHRSRLVSTTLPGAPSVATFDPAGRRIAVGTYNAGIAIVGVGGQWPITLAGHSEYVSDLAFSPDGRDIVSASEDGTARIWHASGGAAVRVLRGHNEGVRSAAYSYDGRRVVTAGADGTIRIWRLAGGRPIVLYGHHGAVESARFNRAGNRIVSAGVDGSVRIWDAAGGEAMVVLYTHDGPAQADFSADGRRVVSASRDGTVRVSACDVCGPFSDVLRLAHRRADSDLDAVEQERYVSDG